MISNVSFRLLFVNRYVLIISASVNIITIIVTFLLSVVKRLFELKEGLKMKKTDQLYTVLIWIMIGSIIIMCILSVITLKRHFDGRNEQARSDRRSYTRWGRMNGQE